jgi:predicted patatin/cPLA2 family phospholipase
MRRTKTVGTGQAVLPRLEAMAGADDPVLRLAVERAMAGSRPGRRTDGARLALAIEGGGMAGSVSAGMCIALESLGLVESFDVIYGSSSGALNASYLAAGQVRSRAALYLAAAEGRLVDPGRALRGRPPFQLTEVVHSLLCAHPHDDRVLGGRPPLRVTATRVEDKHLDVLADFVSVAEVRQAVWASCAIPILAGDIVDFRGTSYVDGGLIESIPFGVALREGASHVLVLRARPADYRFRDYPAPLLRLVRRLLRDAPGTLAELIRDRPARYNAEARLLQSAADSEVGGRVCQICPPSDVRRTSQFEARSRCLSEALRLGERSALAALAPYLGQSAELPAMAA